MQADSRGLALTTASETAAQHLDAAVADFLDYGTQASAKVKAALDADPGFALALCLRGYFLMMLETRAVLPKVQQTLAEIERHAGALTRREQLHVAALKAWADGDITNACFHWEEVLTVEPLDLMALKLHHTMTFYTGRSDVMRSVVSGVLGAWGDAVPGTGYVQGMYAYALEECGAYAEAERWGRQAVERNPGDLWAIHSVAHVLEMQARSAEGVDFLSVSRDQWKAKNGFKAHVWWHAALFLIAQGKYDRVLALYDDEMCSVNSESYVDVSNQAALLKRLAIGGVDVGNRWHALSEHAEKRIHEHMLPFRDAHFGLALAADGKLEAARRHIESMAGFAAGAKGWRAEATRDVVIPLCEALIAGAAGDYDTACDLMWPLRHDIASIGGSHAQRDLFAQIMCDAAVRGNRLGMARNLLSERVLSRGSRKGNWLAYAEVLAALGETAGAEAARRKAETAPDAGA